MYRVIRKSSFIYRYMLMKSLYINCDSSIGDLRTILLVTASQARVKRNHFEYHAFKMTMERCLDRKSSVGTRSKMTELIKKVE